VATGARGKLMSDEYESALEAGWDLLTQGRAEEAAVVARRLSSDDAAYRSFRMGVAQHLNVAEKYGELVEFLDWCRREEPGNHKYTAMLGTAYARSGTAAWVEDGGHRWPTEQKDVVEARACADAARDCAKSLEGSDDPLFEEIRCLEGDIALATEPSWDGNTLATCSGVVAAGGGLFGYIDGIDWMGGLMMLVMIAMYIAGSFNPRWEVRAREVRAREPRDSGFYWGMDPDEVERERFRSRVLLVGTKALWIFWWMPFIAPWKFGKKVMVPLVGRLWRSYRANREEVQKLWLAWNRRREEALREGREFTEPPPGEAEKVQK